MIGAVERFCGLPPAGIFELCGNAARCKRDSGGPCPQSRNIPRGSGGV